MSTHKTAALKAVFVAYSLRTSPTGEYYVFNVIDDKHLTDICRMDAIHKSKVQWIFDAIDQNEKVIAPVIRDLKSGYRIDLSAVDDFNPSPQSPAPVLPPKPSPEPRKPAKTSPKGKTRIQMNIEPWKHEFIERLAAAEGYETYTDWLRGIIDRVIEAAQAKEEANG